MNSNEVLIEATVVGIEDYNTAEILGHLPGKSRNQRISLVLVQPFPELLKLRNRRVTLTTVEKTREVNPSGPN